VRRSIRNDEPDSHCFGCSPHNPRGLQLAFEQVAGDAIEARIPGADGELLTRAGARWRRV
jgi:hypothetical protein